MKAKTQDLIGPTLDWAVAMCEGKNITLMRNTDGSLFPQPVWADGLWRCNYSSSWSQGGPIIEREEIAIAKGLEQWCAFPYGKTSMGLQGPTPLVAAMRCFVVAKFGDELELPQELQEMIEDRSVPRERQRG